MVVYLDAVFALNCLADGAALYATGRLSGLPVRWRRLLAAAALGGTYAAACCLPGLAWAGSVLPQAAVAAGLVRLTFGRREPLLRQTLLFFLLSCAMAGVLLAAARLADGRDLTLDWRIFFLAGGGCFAVLSAAFRGGTRHAAAGQLCRCTVERRGREACVTALLDTGHTLTDGLSGRPVLTVHWAALEPLWTEKERQILSRLGRDGAETCLARLGAGSGFRLLPYQAVGIGGGLLLCFRAGRAELDGAPLGDVTVALSPTPVSDGGGYAALWGGALGKEGGGYAA